MQEQFGVETEVSGARRVLRLRGELDMATAPELERAVRAGGDGVGGEMVFDLSDLEFIDSSGIRALLLATQAIEAAGGRTAIVPGEKVRRVFEVAGLADMLTPGASANGA